MYRYRQSSIGKIIEKILLIAAVAGFVVLLYAVLAYLGAKRDRQGSRKMRNLGSMIEDGL
jgi:hypothetical protein